MDTTAPSSAAVLENGVIYLRGGLLDRAATSFEVAVRGAGEPAVRSEALRRLADVKRRRALWDEALTLLVEAVQIARDHALCDHAASALNIVGTIHLQRGAFDEAVDVYLQALLAGPSARQTGLICQNLGTAHAQRGFHNAAAAWYARSSSAFESAGCPREQILAQNNQGSVLLDQGDLAAAEAIFRAALRRTQSLPKGDAELQALVEINLAEALARQQTDLESAYQLTVRATGHFSASENLPHRVACHRVFALITELQGYPELALGALERGWALAREIQSAQEITHFEAELGRVRAICSSSTSSGPES